MNNVIDELKEKLNEAVRQNPADGLLFSGGLDSGILAALNSDLKAITVTLETYGRDWEYSRSLAEHLKIKYYHKVINIEEAVESIPEVIRILKSFDPAIPNDITVYFGLTFAKEMGIKSVLTGDGSDELLAGYDYMKEIDDLNEYIKRISRSMHFSSNDLGGALGLNIKQPYMEREFIEFCHQIKPALKIKDENGKIWGKWILRKAFEDILPARTTWQDKRPLEQGSGTTKLREIITSKVSDNEFKEKQSIYPIKFINKEHHYYYEIYKKVVDEIPKVGEGEKGCPNCGAGIKQNSFHCKVCGWTNQLTPRRC